MALPELDGGIEPIVFAGRDSNTGKSHSLPDRIDSLCSRAINWAKLAKKEKREKKLAITVFSFPPDKGNVGEWGLEGAPGACAHSPAARPSPCICCPPASLVHLLAPLACLPSPVRTALVLPPLEPVRTAPPPSSPPAGTAAYLNVFGSIYRVLKDLRADGYNVGDLPASEEGLIKSVLTAVSTAARSAGASVPLALPGKPPACSPPQQSDWPAQPAQLASVPSLLLPAPHPGCSPAPPPPPARPPGRGQVQLCRPEHRLQDVGGRVPEAVPLRRGARGELGQAARQPQLQRPGGVVGRVALPAGRAPSTCRASSST